jgi:hypothetical protein
MSGKKTLKKSNARGRSSRSSSRSSSSRSSNIRRKLLTGITKGMIVGNAPEKKLQWGNVEGLTEENVAKVGFNAALKKHLRITAKKTHRYPNWIEMIDENAKRGINLEDSLRRLRRNLSPKNKHSTHKNIQHHMTKGQKAQFYKEKAQREAEKEKIQYAEWKKYNPGKNMSEFLSLRAIRKFLDKVESKNNA